MEGRLLNPKLLKIDLLSLPVVSIDGDNYRFLELKGSFTEEYNGCQCYKDCGCIDLYPKTVSYHHKLYRHIDNDGTDKAFYSMEMILRKTNLREQNK